MATSKVIMAAAIVISIVITIPILLKVAPKIIGNVSMIIINIPLFLSGRG